MGYRPYKSAPGPFPPIPPHGLGALPYTLGSLDDPGEMVSIDGIPSLVSRPLPNHATFRRVAIGPGARGTKDTLDVMAALAIEAAQDPYFIQFARSIVRDCPGKDYRCAADAILQFVKQNVKYQEDPAVPGIVDYVSSPSWTLFVEGAEDCDGMSTLIAALDMAVGMFAAFKSVPLNIDAPGVFSHVYALAGSPVGHSSVLWLAQDPVPDRAVLGWEPPAQELTGEPLFLIVGE